MSKSTLDTILSSHGAEEGELTESLKQAILRWVADEVINAPIDYSISPDGYTKGMGVAEKRLRGLQYKILAQHGYKGANQ